MSQLLNTVDYSYTELTLAIVGSILWVASYLLLVKDGFKNKFVEIPFFAVCGNIAWEFLYAFVFVDYINLGKIYVWGYQAWFFIDIVIVFLLFKYGRKQVQSGFIKKYFFLFVPVLMIFYGFLLYFWISMGFDNTPFNAIHEMGTNMSKVVLGATSAFILNLVISALYIRLFLTKGDRYPFSIWNGIFRWLGTALFTVMFHLIDPGNLIVTTLGILIFCCDIIYIRLVYKKIERKSLRINKVVPFVSNDKFDSKWIEKREVLAINGVSIKYVTDERWHYKSSTFECRYVFYEGNMILQEAKGKMSNEDALIAVPMITEILNEMECESKEYYFISDSREVKMAEPKAREISMAFFEDNEYLNEFIVIVAPIVKSMIKMARIKAIVDKFIITKSREEAFSFYCNAILGDEKKLNKSRFSVDFESDTLQSPKENLNHLLRSISLNQFHKIDEFEIDKTDPFAQLHEGFRVISSDKKLLIKELNDFKEDVKSKLEKEQTQFTSLFENSGLYSIILDEKFNLLDYNEITKELFQKLGIDLIAGFNISNFVTDEQIKVFEKRRNQLKTSERVTFKHKQKFPDGFTGWYETSFFKLDANDMALIGVVSHDITNKVNLEKEKIKLFQNLQYKSSYLRSFHHTISHSLNHEIANIEQIVSHLNDPLVDIRKKLDLLEDLSTVTEQLNQVKKELNASLTEEKEEVPLKASYKEEEVFKTKELLKHVILIDDDPITNSVNKLTIRSFSPDIRVDTFKNAKKAIEAITNSSDLPQTILLDINMPVMNGWEFLESFDAFAFSNGIKIHVLTSSESQEESEKANAYKSVTSFISKPLNIEKLKDLLS